MNQMNEAGFRWVNGWAGNWPLLDKAMEFLTNSVPYVAVLIILTLWFTRNSETQPFRRLTALYAAGAAALALTINMGIQLFYYHPRPFVAEHVHQLIPHAADSSFASDHAIIVFAVAGMLWLRHDRLRVPVLIWALLSGLSRIYAGVHYPFDVLGGAAISLLTGGLLLAVSSILEPRLKKVLSIYTRIAERIWHRETRRRDMRGNEK